MANLSDIFPLSTGAGGLTPVYITGPTTHSADLNTNILVDASGGAVEIDLPDITDEGTVQIRDITGDVNTTNLITIDPHASDTIYNQTAGEALTMETPHSWVQLDADSNNNNWGVYAGATGGDYSLATATSAGVVKLAPKLKYEGSSVAYTSNNPINFNIEVFKEGSISISSGVVTVGETGLYIVTGTIQSSSIGGARMFCETSDHAFHFNGMLVTTSPSNDSIATCTGIVYLTAGSTVQLNMTNNGTTIASSQENFIAVAKLI